MQPVGSCLYPVCQHYLWSASLGEEPPTGKHHPRTWSVSIIALEQFAWWGQCGGEREWMACGGGGVAVLRVWGPHGRGRESQPWGFPFPAQLGVEAPDVAALERQRRFNPGLGTHVSYPPCFLRLPRKGSPGPVLVGGAGWDRGWNRRHVGLARQGLNQVTQCTWRLQDLGGAEGTLQPREVQLALEKPVKLPGVFWRCIPSLVENGELWVRAGL